MQLDPDMQVLYPEALMAITLKDLYKRCILIQLVYMHMHACMHP